MLLFEKDGESWTLVRHRSFAKIIYCWRADGLLVPRGPELAGFSGRGACRGSLRVWGLFLGRSFSEPILGFKTTSSRRSTSAGFWLFVIVTVPFRKQSRWVLTDMFLSDPEPNFRLKTDPLVQLNDHKFVNFC